MMFHQEMRSPLGREAGRLGRLLFVSGAGLLSFSSVGLMRRDGPYLEVQDVLVALFILASALVLAGEVLRVIAGDRTGRASGRLRARTQVETLCDFCGKRSEAPNAEGFSRCLACGKTGCGRCSDLKGKEMGRDSRRCPACGSQVY